MSKTELLLEARDMALKFIAKVDSGRARSRETYAEMQSLVERIEKAIPLQIILHDKKKRSNHI